MTALPKQWEHWARSMRLEPHHSHGTRSPRRASWMYLQGRGHYWRVNCHGMLQCGDTYADFDRWALCRNIVELPMPKTRQQFRVTVLVLLDKANQGEQA